MIHSEIKIKGTVQGVGFRPFVHKLSEKLSINGFVRNTGDGVFIVLEGEKDRIDEFVRGLDSPPPLAVIKEISRTDSADITGYSGFAIESSEKENSTAVVIPPDAAVCDECRKELLTPGNRRYRYPFINCTECGPRFTAVRSIPYDREYTSMKEFPLCPECGSEFRDITTRRYNAQTDCCPVCGPVLSFKGNDGTDIPGDPILLAKEAILDGMTVAVKGIGGFHLACLAEEESVLRLKERKHRSEKPLALMGSSFELIERYCFVSDDEKKLLGSPAHPIVLLEKKDRSSLSFISENSRIGFMLPYTPLHCLLLEDMPLVVMTSGNISETPIISDNSEAFSHLASVADRFLVHNREIVVKCDDSLVFCHDGKEYFIRRSRGYVPSPINVSNPEKHCIFAAGAEEKASFAIIKDDSAYMSQHIGDLKSLETLNCYEEYASHFMSLTESVPTAAVCDLHPDFYSTGYAETLSEEYGIPLKRVQHHKAHFASCLQDNGFRGDAIGIICDGTGLGDDNTIWGCEFFSLKGTAMEHRGSLMPFELAGGDSAARNGYICGNALLKACGIDDTSVFTGFEKESSFFRLISGTPCTSLGRLFDGVSSILGIKHVSSYEGQAASLLESMAVKTGRIYPFPAVKHNDMWYADFRPCVKEVYNDSVSGTPNEESAYAFIEAVSSVLSEIFFRISEETGIKTAALSGGCFQNMLLLDMITEKIESRGFTVLCHKNVSCNDQGIPLGQAYMYLRGIE